MYEHPLSFLLDKCLAIGLVSHRISVCLILQDTARMFPPKMVSFCIPTSTMYECFRRAITFSEFDIVIFLHFYFFNLALLIGNVMISHCGFNFFFSSVTHDVQHLFVNFFATCISSLVKCILKSFASVFLLHYLRLECSL